MQIALVRDVKTPARGSDKSAGIDFFIPNDYIGTKGIWPQEDILIPSGVKAKIPEGYMLTAFNKSGVATKKGLIVGACVCDEDYQGEIHLHLINTTTQKVDIAPGEKIVQFVLVPILYEGIEVVKEDELFETETERGAGGFGSTGTS